MDTLFSTVEKLVTPISLQQTGSTSKAQLKRSRSLQKGLLAGTAAVLVVLFSVSAVANAGQSKDTITIGGKDFTEQFIVTHLMADMIEDRTDLRVIRKENLGGTQVAFNALRNANIDL